MKKYTDLINETLPEVKEIFPWDLQEKIQNQEDILLLDIREPYEFDVMRIKGSLNVPRGVLESACDWGYEETVPGLAAARDRQVVVMCRSGNRSVLAAYVMQLMGYKNVYSLKTGVAGWNDYEQPLVNNEDSSVDLEVADAFFENKVRPDQMPPES